MSFNIPEKQIIVNSDEQVRLLEDDGTAYADGDVSAATDGFIIEGFLSLVTVSQLPNFTAWNNGQLKTVKILRDDSEPRTKQSSAYTVTSTAADDGDVFRVVFESIDWSPTDFQNQPVSKIYQISDFNGLATAADIAKAMELIILADDPDAEMFETVSASGAILTLVAKNEGVKFDVYVDPVLSKIRGTQANTAEASNGKHNYYQLKNIDWAKDIDFDRNEQWQPRKGETYTAYKFYLESVGFISDGNNVPNVDAPTATTPFKLWVADSATTFKEAMDFLVEDVNPLT